jgi:uncharacterized membrane protein YbaN (DUF454 family)
MDEENQERNNRKDKRARLTRQLLIAAGSICVVLGVIGIFLPLLPTTPFLLLAAACYVRSSDRLNRWLLNHRVLGPYIRHYREDKAIPLKGKIFTIILLWLTISISAIFAVHILWIRIILFAIAVGVTIHVLTFKTLKK